jgi:hypothetical protein
MSDYAIIFQGLAGLLAVFFIILTYLNTKTWQWPHITALFLVFIATMVFSFYAAMVMRTRMNWIKYHDTLEKSVSDAEPRVEKLIHGDPLDVEGKTPSVIGLREKLNQVILDRGRVWRNCVPTAPLNPQTGTVTLTMGPPTDPTAPPPAAGAKKHMIEAKMVFHAFREARSPDGLLIVPIAYIGEFQATAAANDTVTLTQVQPLAADQLAAGRNPGPTGPPTWTLYENCPVDGHQWFTGLDQKALSDLIPAGPTGLRPDQYQKLIDSYLRDGKETAENDPPDNVWVEVKFLKPYEITVDAVAAGGIDTEPFNLEGQAVFNRLRRELPQADKEPAKVKFGPGASEIPTAILMKQAADDLVAQGICEITGKPIFRRTLTDYERKLHSINQRIVTILTQQRQLDLDNKALVASTEKAEAQAKLLEDLKTKLSADLDKAKQEKEELQKYVESLKARLDELQNTLSELYRSNKALSRELNDTSAQLTQDAEQRAREATAKSP